MGREGLNHSHENQWKMPGWPLTGSSGSGSGTTAPCHGFLNVLSSHRGQAQLLVGLKDGHNNGQVAQGALPLGAV
jgi:hypothetical protein